jgi:peptidoglycan/LPS O-acetylase OafA/YrhL
MALLRRVLYWEAAAWATLGLAVAIAPRFLLVTVLAQPPYPEYASLRIVGIQAVGISLIAVLIAQRIEDHWWWSWAIAIVAAASATVLALTALFGLPGGAPSWPWWALAAASLASAIGLLAGMAVAGTERPIT